MELAVSGNDPGGGGDHRCRASPPLPGTQSSRARSRSRRSIGSRSRRRMPGSSPNTVGWVRDHRLFDPGAASSSTVATTCTTSGPCALLLHPGCRRGSGGPARLSTARTNPASARGRARRRGLEAGWCEAYRDELIVLLLRDCPRGLAATSPTAEDESSESRVRL